MHSYYRAGLSALLSFLCVYLTCVQSAVSQVSGRLVDWNRVTSVHRAVIKASPERQRVHRVLHLDHTRCYTPPPSALHIASVSKQYQSGTVHCQYEYHV